MEADPERDRSRHFIEKPEWLPELDVRIDKDGLTTMANTSRKTAGIDTSKLKLDVALAHDAANLEVENSPQGFKELTTWLKRRRVDRVGIEATGGYERGVVKYMRAKGITVIVLQPMQVKAYAQFLGQRAKNDKIDAQLIAVCAVHSQAKTPPDPRLEELLERTTRLEQIEEDIARAKTRREAFRNQDLRDHLTATIKTLNAERKALIKQIKAEIRSHGDLKRRLELILSVPGIGERTALALIIRMPELGTLTREQAASLVGLAPFDDKSGKRDGDRHIAGGRSRLRKSLYAAALPAAHFWNPALKSLYKRLRKENKRHKVALVAVARKLMIFANAVVAKDELWKKPETQS